MLLFLSRCRLKPRIYHSLFTINDRRLLATSRVPWTPAEDAILKNFVLTEGRKWTTISARALPGRTPDACLSRWSEVLNPALRHGAFSPAEHEAVRRGVAQLGVGNWTNISSQFLNSTRSPRQVANSWKLTLDPNIRKRKKWDTDEDKAIIEGVQKFGVGKWTAIKDEMLPTRTRVQTRQRWVGSLDEDQKRGPWTTEEIDILLRRTLLYGTQNWNEVAEGLLGRSATVCKQKWWSAVNPELISGQKGWDEEETKTFWARTEVFGNNWLKVAEGLQGRSSQQCSQKFRKVAKVFSKSVKDEADLTDYCEFAKWLAKLVNNTGSGETEGPFVHRRIGPWLPDEDARLLQLIKSTADNKRIHWSTIARHMPERTSAQCKDRYVNHLSATLKGRWSPSEDSLLASLVSQHGRQWSEIAELVPGRTPVQCRRRWSDSLQYQIPSEPVADDSKLVDSKPATTIQRGSFTEDERTIIASAWSRHGPDWKTIAQLYFPHRTPEQCFRAWRSVYKGIERKQWTEREDDALIFAVEHLGIAQEGTKDKRVQWREVAAIVPGRTARQCRIRWMRTLRLGIHKGLWTNQEVLQLEEAVQRNQASDWEAVAQEVGGGRTAQSCMEKWKRGWRVGGGKKWSAEEISRLRSAVMRLEDGKWEKVANEIGGGRSGPACRLKYCEMTAGELTYKLKLDRVVKYQQRKGHVEILSIEHENRS